jgi:molybdopterin synthase sulfur carrier subunit
MNIKVRIPLLLQKLTQNQSEVEVGGRSLADALKNLAVQHPGFGEKLYDEKGDLRKVIDLFVNGESIRFLDGMQTRLKAGDVITILPAVSLDVNVA